MRNKNSKQTWRSVLFSIGWIAAIISAAACVCSWVDPFPLLSDGRGGWRLNPLEGWVLVVGLSTGFATLVFAAFGKRVGRVLLVVAGMLLVLINIFRLVGQSQVRLTLEHSGLMAADSDPTVI